MSFGSISIGANVYNSISKGLYNKSTVAFGQPLDLIKLSPGRVSNGKTSASVSRHLEKDVTEGGIVYRRKLSVIDQMIVPVGFTTTEVDTLVSDIATLVTVDFLSRLLLGED